MSSEMIPDVQFSDNTNQRTPCVLILDGSSSMAGQPINQLNEGLRTFESQLKSNQQTALRVQVLVIRIGGHEQVDVLCDWCDAIDFKAPVIEANGTTPLGVGMQMALDKVEAQKSNYDANGISSTRPWIMIISDGEPNDYGWEEVARRSCEAENRKKVAVYPIGTESANFDSLALFSNKSPQKLKGLNFNELFIWLSRSMTAVSSSSPGERVQLPPAGWMDAEA
ncbi:MAG: VWA domain-containing protein [Desulforhopalus sp.]